MSSPSDRSPYLTVKHLLSAVGILLTVTFGLFTWEANRAINKLDTVAASVSDNALTDVSQETRLVSVEKQAQRLEEASADHEKRITVLETLGVHDGQPGVSYPHKR